MESFGGLIRSGHVIVGRYATPEPEALYPLLNDWWDNLVETDKKAHERPVESREWIARFYHFWFLWIHPFRDGNGRTSRLFLNMLRLRWGLPWLVIKDSEKWQYYAEIAFHCETWFRKRYSAIIYPQDRFGRILDPKPPQPRANPLLRYVNAPVGHVPMRCSIRPRK
jgi:hypothetical protein